MNIKVTIISEISNTVLEFNSAEEAAIYFAKMAGIKLPKAKEEVKEEVGEVEENPTLDEKPKPKGKSKGKKSKK